jgi:hypothetical protein
LVGFRRQADRSGPAIGVWLGGVPVAEVTFVGAGAVGEAEGPVGVDRELELLSAESYRKAVELAIT